MRVVIVALMLVCIGIEARSQRFGGNPSSVIWKSLRSEGVKVVFPLGMEDEARRIVEWTEVIDRDSSGKLGKFQRQLPVVLQKFPVISNAYVGLGPWRSEFYTFPPQSALELGSTNWIDNLVVHEYRHAHQFSNFRKGLSRFAYWVAGEQGQALANSAAIPDWFFEGDAVYEETKWLSQGRGRLPYFFDQFHSLWSANKQYSYQKLRNRSLKDLVPNHYQLGYLLVAHGYTSYGDDFWEKVTADAVRYKGLFYPFQKAVKKYSGQSYKAFVSAAIKQYKSNVPLTENPGNHQLITHPNKRLLVNYHFPVLVGKDSLIVLKKPNNVIPHWVMIQGNKEKRIGIKAIGVEDYFTYKGGYIVYTANGFDPRWSWKEYSDINMLNIYDASTIRLTKGKRYLSPDLSHDGKQVVAASYSSEGESTLDFIEVSSQQLRHQYKHPQGLYLSFPVFSKDDRKVYFISRKDNGESALQVYHLDTKQTEEVLPFVNTPLSLLRLNEDWLLFTVTQHQKNELWSYNIATKQLTRIVSSPMGAYAGDIDPLSSKVVYSSPTAEGEQVMETTFQPSKQPASFKAAELVYPVRLSSPAEFESASATQQIKPYKRSSGLINIHSWRPFYEQPEWSFTVYGQNVLNTMQSSYDYIYNENEGSHKIGANLAYGGLYPWITAATSYTVNRTFNDQTRTFQWNEWNGNIGLRLPLNFTYGKLYKRLDMSATINGQMVDYQAKSIPQPQDRMLGFLQQQVTWSMQSQQAVQHIFPRFASVIRAQNKMTIGDIRARQFFTTGQVYLPGLFKTHSLVVGAAFQARDTLRQYIFNNGFAMSRGYVAYDFPRMWKWNMNYHLPLVYPDFGIANIVYFQRIRANVFFDNTFLKSLRTGNITNLRSAGTEIYFDTRWWNQQPVSFGFRYSRLLDQQPALPNQKSHVWEFILPLNLLPN